MSKLNEKLQSQAVSVRAENTPMTPQKEMEGMLKSMEKEIARAVGNIITPDRFARIALSVWNGNNAFWKCTRVSFLSSMMKAAQAGLEPNTVLGEAYLIPYGNEVTFQLGYKGILALCYRSKMYKSIYSHEVYANDKFEYEYGLNKKLTHIPADVPEGEPVYFYAVYKTTDGGEDFVVWSRDRVIKHAKQYSKTYSSASSPWQKSFNSMAKKTVLIDALRYAPKSVEVTKAISNDETSGNEGYTDVDFTEVTNQEPELNSVTLQDVSGEDYEQIVVQ